VTDAPSMHIDGYLLTPSRYVYFVYQLLLNVGYGDTVERSVLSSLVIVGMTLLVSPLLIIVFQDFVRQSNQLVTSITRVQTWHHAPFVTDLISQLTNRTNDQRSTTATSDLR
jgi:predicted PurR-regulated permease PerM